MSFLHLGEEAATAFHRGRHRIAATKYLEAFDDSVGHKYNQFRWQIFHGYTSILKEEYFTASTSDMEALNRISNDKAEAKLCKFLVRMLL